MNGTCKLGYYGFWGGIVVDCYHSVLFYVCVCFMVGVARIYGIFGDKV